VAAFFDGVIMIAGTVYVVFFGDEFLGQFQGFLITLGVPVAAWCGIMLADIATRRRDYAESICSTAPAGTAMCAGCGSNHRAGHRIGWGLFTNTGAHWLTWQGYLLDPLVSAARRGSGRSPTWACCSPWCLFLVQLVGGYRSVQTQE